MTSIIVVVHLQMITTMMVVDILLSVLKKKTTKKVTKKIKQYSLILNFMADGEWYKTSEITEVLGLKDTRTKELLKELVSLDKLVDDGKTKGTQYRLK